MCQVSVVATGSAGGQACISIEHLGCLGMPGTTPPQHTRPRACVLPPRGWRADAACMPAGCSPTWSDMLLHLDQCACLRLTWRCLLCCLLCCLLLQLVGATPQTPMCMPPADVALPALLPALQLVGPHLRHQCVPDVQQKVHLPLLRENATVGLQKGGSGSGQAATKLL